MDKAKEISALWSEIKPQIGELVSLCHEVESHYEVTADAYQRGYEQGYKDGYNEPGKGKIQIGDEIETPSGLKGYVVNFTDDELVHYVSSEGRFGTMGMSAVSKTGRHFPEIAEVLQKMKES